MADPKSSRLIKYLNLGYSEFVRDLTDFSKIYFPKTSKDLSDASSAQMMIEQASFIGDILSHYIEDRFANSNLNTAKDIEQIFNLARFLGYPLQGPPPARGVCNFYCTVPATTGSNGNYTPDMRYAINFKNVQLQNNNGIVFEALDDVNFIRVNISSSAEARVSAQNQAGFPTHYVLKTSAEVIGAKTVSQTTTVGDYKAFREVELSEPNVVDVLSVIDSDGDHWYEVSALAQEAIFEGITSVESDNDTVPYLLKIKTVPKRFIKKINPTSGKTSLVFGTGKAVDVGTPFVPDPADLAIDLKGKLNFAPIAIDPQNFLKTKTLGLAPYNTTLTIKARVGGGKITNTAVNSLNSIISKEADFNSTNLSVSELNNTLSSFSSRNLDPVLGGDEAETPKEIQQNASAFFSAQMRLNTREDYIARCLSLPSKFGKIFRVYATTNSNPNGGVQIHVVAKNASDQLIAPTINLKKNLKQYLSLFTRLNQGIDILDGKIINLGLDYSIVVQPGYNKTEVKMNTLRKVKEFFDVNRWQLSQPIILDDVRVLIKETEGVLSIAELTFKNKNNIIDGVSYSQEVFDVAGFTKNGILFCPNNAIFEIRYSQDIRVGAL